MSLCDAPLQKSHIELLDHIGYGDQTHRLRVADSLAPAQRIGCRAELGCDGLRVLVYDQMLAEKRQFPTMDGRTIFKEAVRRLPAVTQEVLSQAGMGLEEIDLFIPHQANLRINQAFAKAMGLPPEKVYNNIQQYGNTTAASIPLALDEALEKEIIGEGSTVLFLGLGAGVTWGAMIYRF